MPEQLFPQDWQLCGFVIFVHYRAMILEAGFKILEETPYYPTPQQEEILRTLPIHEDFKHYTFDDLKILGSNFVLTK